MAFRAKSYDRPYLERLLIDLACTAPELADRLAGLAGRNLVCGAMLYGEWEQAPRREHRVALGSERDPFGIPRVELHWRRDPRAQRTMHASLRLLADRIAAGGLGRVRLEEWVLDPEVEPLPSDKMAGWHHMGGARMSLTPRDGVVDADLKVHGVDNLFVCSSAVFPNGGGFANPTFTIVQLALRLSERLASTRI
jgi:choline dehydrogenase-like flavoprotein